MLIKKSFYFVRHGETDYNRRQLCAGGGTDVPLNDLGQQQAKNLREKLIDLNLGKVISSPMIRARQTAELAYSGDIHLEPNIREWELGDFEHAPVAAFIHFVETLPNHLPLPNGESKDELVQRVIPTINATLKDYDDPVLFVSHGAVYWSLLQAIDHPDHFLENGDLMLFQPSLKGWKVRKL